MTLQELTDKMKSGHVLTETEQNDFFFLLDIEFGKLKKEQPEKYLEFIKELSSVAHDLNADLKKVQEQLKA